ncbi:P-loop containing nucleoside triphosphate hydrolase protein [Nemania sp. NC0429]|nr:P-loop containing nucleoside triphosphate hydrolase protein [Nemania sp. NC0429]
MAPHHPFAQVGVMASTLRGVISRFLSKILTYLHANKSKKPLLIVFILGPPGAGKETHSKRLRRDFSGLTHLSYGDVLRHYVSIPASWVSTFPRRYGDVDGDPVPSAGDAVRLIRETIESGAVHDQRIWLIDGFPRSKDHMDAWMAAQMPVPQCIFFLEANSLVLRDRVLGRAPTSGRPDDADADRVDERIGRNMRASEAMLQACGNSGARVIHIDVNRDVDVVYQDIKEHFRKLIEL